MLFAVTLLAAAATTQAQVFDSFANCPRACSATAVLDFEGLSEGQIVSTISPGSGVTEVSGTLGTCTITVSALSRGGSGSRPGSANAAMIFDGTCGGGTSVDCSGDDGDLFAPDFGNLLIISEDLDGSDPDDAARGGTLTVDLSGCGPGVFDVCSFVGVDLEDLGTPKFAEFVGGVSGAVVASIPAEQFDTVVDGEVVLVEVPGATAISDFSITTDDSGAYDEFAICVPVTQGCTPGYWKNLKKHEPAWCLDPDTLFDDVFTPLPDSASDGLTLVQMLSRGGGGYAAYGRHVVAAYLNACNADVDYVFGTVDAVLALHDAAVAASDGDESNIEPFKDLFEDGNEDPDCPLGNFK